MHFLKIALLIIGCLIGLVILADLVLKFCQKMKWVFSDGPKYKKEMDEFLEEPRAIPPVDGQEISIFHHAAKARLEAEREERREK